jgi:hypothetical protein
MLAYNNQIVSGRGGAINGGPGLLRERAVWGCGQGEGGSQGERGRKMKKTINSKIRTGFAVIYQGGDIELWHWWWWGGGIDGPPAGQACGAAAGGVT